MKLNQLEYFCAVCRYHSITRAAEELYVTQPTISVAIRELENELKLRLFHHEKNRISLTKEGEAFYRRAEALLKETRAMVSEFSSLGEQETPIRIGIPPLISTVFFPSLTDGFQEKTGLPVQLFEYGSVKACNLVQEEKLDCALVNMDFYNIDQFNSHVLMEDSYVYCIGRNHRYAGEKEVTFESDGPLQGYGTYAQRNRILQPALHDPQLPAGRHLRRAAVLCSGGQPKGFCADSDPSRDHQ